MSTRGSFVAKRAEVMQSRGKNRHQLITHATRVICEKPTQEKPSQGL